MSTLSLAVSTIQGREFPSPTDPDADPANDPNNPLRYIASNVLTEIAFSLILMTALTQTYWIRRWGAKWMLSMTIGAYTFAFGIGTRFGLHALHRRLSRYLGATQHLLVDPRWITAVFISSNVTTFLIQAAGGAVSTAADQVHLARIGSRARLALQLGSFFIFTCIFLTFLWRTYAHEPDIWEAGGKKWYDDWRALAGAFCFEGRLATMESFFYGLDTLPLLIAVVIYVPFWPGRFIPAIPVLYPNRCAWRMRSTSKNDRCEGRKILPCK
ncbi:RTA1-like protein [Armillaria fumosa]|nr:RTA1-like protein [Armillaria fumosa]